MEPKYIISVDIGTQGTKAGVFDLDLNLIASAFEVSNLIQPEAGVIYQDAYEIYRSVAGTIKAVMEKSKALPGQIGAIGLDGQMAGVMGIDKDGQASTYYDSWLDMRSRSQLDKMRAIGGDKMIAVSGGQICCNHASKILWWKSEYPDVYKKTAKWVMPHGYVAGKIAGLNAENAVIDYTCLHFNSFSDNYNKGWSKELLKDFGVDYSLMPRVVSPVELIGKVGSEFAQMSGLTVGIPIVAGAGDTAADTFGSGMFVKGRIEDIAGTASVMCCVVDEYLPDFKNKTLTMMRSPVDGLWLPLAYVNGGGLCLRWFRDSFANDLGNSYEALEHVAQKVPAGSEGLLFCPHFSGRVSPEDSTLKGSFVNLDFKHTRAHFYRAIMEGIALEYQYYLSLMRQNYKNASFDKMTTVGGGAASPLFNQIKADALRLSVTTFENKSAARLVGGAVIAGFGAGLLCDYKLPIEKSMRPKSTYMPNESNSKLYDGIGHRYRDMLKMTSQFYRA